MSSDLIAEATKETFRELVADGLTMVDVWGPDCQPCLALLPHVEQMAAENEGAVKVIKLEAPTARRLCMELRVMGLPAFLLFRDGTEIARINGPQVNAAALTAWLETNKTKESV